MSGPQVAQLPSFIPRPEANVRIGLRFPTGVTGSAMAIAVRIVTMATADHHTLYSEKAPACSVARDLAGRKGPEADISIGTLTLLPLAGEKDSFELDCEK